MHKLYIVVRSDISAGLQVAQSCHAVCSFAAEYPESWKQWHEGPNNIVCLSVPTVGALMTLEDKAIAAEVENELFFEPDLDGEPTALALGAGAEKLVSNLPLALKAQCVVLDAA
jgi:peptidyl-tRNA hydrolase